MVKPHDRLVLLGSLVAQFTPIAYQPGSLPGVFRMGRTPPGKSYLKAGFPLRCFQRLSLPNIATRRCSWRHNRYTRGSFIPVLSY